MTAPAPTRAEDGRYTVVYEGDAAGNRILNGEPGDLIERAAQAEAEVARLTQERDEALCLAEGPSTLLDLARGSVSRGMELHAAEAEVARLTAAIRLLLPFVDYAAGEGLAFVPSFDESAMDAADICTAVAKALNIELGGADYMTFAARTALEAPHEDK